jgi:hypothetical protein
MTLLPLIVERIKEQVEPFSHGGMGEHSVADLLVRKRAEHSHLQPGNDLACVVAQLGGPGLRWHQNEIRGDRRRKRSGQHGRRRAAKRLPAGSQPAHGGVDQDGRAAGAEPQVRSRQNARIGGRGLRRGAGPFPQADGDHPPALQLAALERGRSSKSSTRLQGSSWSWRLGHGARASETPVDGSFARTLAWVHRATRSSRSTAEAQLAGQAVTERR